MMDGVRSHGFTALGPLHEAVARLNGPAAVLAAVIFGALSAFAFAPFHFSAVLLVSFTGLVWMIDGARGQRLWGRAVFLRGWAFGAGYFLVSMHWTAAPFLVEPERTAIFLWMPLILLPAGMGLIWGAAIAMAGAFWSASPSRVFAFALFFALGEFVRGHLFGGFPWNLAGTTWTPGGAVSQAAAIGGVYWLTLVTVFLMAAPATLVDTRDARGLLLRMTPSLAAVMALAFGWSWGAQRIAEPAEMTERAIVLMDAGVPQNEALNIGPDPVLTEYLRMMTYPDGKPGDIIIWPEGAVPAYLLQDPNALDAVVSYLGARTLIAGTTRYEIGANDSRTYYNSLTVLDENVARMGPLALYDKHRLVPFGEYAAVNFIPFGRQVAGLLPPSMQEMSASGFLPGGGATAVEINGIPTFVALICYEGLFPEIPRGVNLGGRAEWLVLISNDGWFGAGVGPAQHYAQNRYRAIETGLPLVRVASRGVSGIIDAHGREIARTAPVEEGPPGWDMTYLRGTLPAPAPVTIFQTRLGGGLLWLSLCLFAGLALLTWRR